MSWNTTLGLLNNPPVEILHTPDDPEETKVEKQKRINSLEKYLIGVYPNLNIIKDDVEIMGVSDFWLMCKNVQNICS